MAQQQVSRGRGLGHLDQQNSWGPWLLERSATLNLKFVEKQIWLQVLQNKIHVFCKTEKMADVYKEDFSF